MNSSDIVLALNVFYAVVVFRYITTDTVVEAIDFHDTFQSSRITVFGCIYNYSNDPMDREIVGLVRILQNPLGRSLMDGPLLFVFTLGLEFSSKSGAGSCWNYPEYRIKSI